ncbi:MAG: molybdate ABC transporter permease subunit [Acidithiobacillus sp.]
MSETRAAQGLSLGLPDGAAGRLPLALLSTLVLLFILAPFSALVFMTDWRHFHFVVGDLHAARVSFLYSTVAVAVVVALGTPLAWWLAHRRSRWWLDALVLMPLLTPPLALGILLASFYGPYSSLGMQLSHLGLQLSNSVPAFILAQIYGAIPYFVLAARAAFEAVPKELEDISRSLGRNAWYTFWRVSLPLARLGLAAGIALAWVRAMGEFGIVLIVAYFPQGIPVKLWVNLQDIGLEAVYPLLWFFFLVAIPVPLFLGLYSRRRAFG